MESFEACPVCGMASALRPKLVLIDERWNQATLKGREFFFADNRVDDIKQSALREKPLEQFINAFYCERCQKAFVSERPLQGERWELRWT